MKKHFHLCKRLSRILLFLIISGSCFAQSKSKIIADLTKNFNTPLSFIENIGQYGKTMKGFEQMGELKFGYEGFGMPILFTPKGLIHLQRKVEKISKEEEEKLERAGVKEEEIERKIIKTDRTITMEWIGANTNPEIIKEEKTYDYHTYGMLTEKAYGYKKIIYKNLYDGIDVVYSFTSTNKLGFEYSLFVQPGADLTKVKMKYGGNVKSITTNSKGNLIIKSDIDGIEETMPVSYYGDKLLNNKSADVKTAYKINENEISFSFPNNYDKTKAIVIDPYITSTSNLTGIQAGKAIDVDYDYAGNVYVAGGGRFVATFAAGATHQHAKYNSAGVLQWTFSGVLTIPTWQADFYYGGWVVDKATGNLFIGQGFAINGFRVIRLSTTGLYDNYISNGNNSFQEAWKMYWFCNNGTPQIICAGGGTTGPTNFAICAPPSPNLISSTNLTGSLVAGQDMTDLVIDPVTNSLYTIYASPLDATTANTIFKNNTPYSAASIAWRRPTGFPNTILELSNRPYLAPGFNDNGSNILAQNSTYIFYWDGLRLEAINKTTGVITGTPLTLAGNTVLMQGGVVADACDNVFIGNRAGIIKVYKFNGSTFDDTPADIPIAGFTTSVYDLALDESKKILYASGDGFVASFDVSAYCPTNIYTINITTNCATASATATISPTPPTGSTITYTLFIGTTQITTNTTGVFTNLLPNTNYTITATINFACSGLQTTANFILPGPIIATTLTHTTCGANTGEINIVASGTLAPYTYSLDGITYNNINPITGLAAGLYTVYVKDANGCITKTNVTILNSNGPTFTFTQTNATCGSNTGTVTITASGGTTPYQYSINNGVTYQTNNFFTGLVSGNYVIKVKDANGCINAANVTILSGPAPILNAIPSTATCGNNNGTITAFGSAGTAPLQYSINGNIFQPSNVFNNLTPGTYTVTVKDAIGCITSVNVVVGSNPAPTVTGVTTPAACGNINGTITATGSNGVAPLTYSINGTTFQASPFFSGLAPGNYTITVKDAVGCIGATTVTIASTGGPTASATSTAANCATANGTITITGSGTAGPYTYSINGTIYFSTSLFTNVAAGNYIVFAKDAAGCIGATFVVVNSIAGPTITATTTPASCTVNNGTITATGSGGSAPLTYSIDGTNYFASNTFPNLAPNTYTVYVKDALGCIQTTTVFVNNASNLGLTLSAVFSSCGNNGIITATATSGVAPLQYNLNGGAYQASNIFSGLAPGNYIITVKDANGCVVSKQATIVSVSALTLSATVPVQATCGSSNAVIIATGSGGTAPLQYSINGTTYQSLGTFLNVAPGTYSVYLKDATGCIITQSITITNTIVGAAITTFTLNTAYFPCDGDVTGKITNPKVNGATCGTCTYMLDFSGTFIPNQTQLFLGVSPGIHYVTVINAAGCTKTIAVNVAPTPLATATFTVVGSPCGASTGSITLTGVGSNQPYHSSINGGATWVTYDPSTTFSGLAPGVYTFINADDASFTSPPDNPGGCTTTLTVVVPATTGSPTISTTQINGTCGLANGSITAIGNGGSGAPFSYNINGGTFQTIGTFTGLAAGTFIVAVKDNAGCIKATTVILTNSIGPTLTVFPSATSCGLTNGTVTVITSSGGTPPYEYSTNGTIYQTSNLLTNLAAGNYTIYIKDALGCFSSIPTTITIGSLPKVTAFTVAASCNSNDGAIFATGSLGVAPYQFSLDGTVYQSNNIFNGLTAGFYTVYLKDDKGCVVTTGITIGNISAATFTTTVVAAKCGNQNGSITIISVTGGTPAYTYSFDGGITYGTSTTSPLLLPGNYTVIVKDGSGCLTTKVVFVSNIVGPQTLTAIVGDAFCEASNGAVTLTATGGTPAYQYSKDGITYQASNILTGFVGGTFTVYVRDVNLCVKSIPVTIINLASPTLIVNASPTTCGLSDGTITATASGGTVPLLYSKDGITFQSSNIFTGLAANTYTITVKDAKNCTNTAIAIVPSPGTPTPTFNAIAPICTGGLLSALPTTSINNIIGTWSPALNNTTTTLYTFTPNAGQCGTTTTMSISVNPNLSPTISCGTITSNSINFTWPSVVAATGYNVSYIVNGGTANNIGPIGNVLNYSVSGLNGNDNVLITITPTGSGCFASANKSCITLACVPPTASISYAGPFCTNITTAQSVSLTGTGAYTTGTYNSTAGLTINATTGAITPSTSTASTYTVTYTIAASGGCPQVTTTTLVTINPKPAPIIISHN